MSIVIFNKKEMAALSNMLKLLNEFPEDTVGEIMALSEKTAEYGIRLTEAAALEIAGTEKSCISDNGRVSFGKSAAVKLTNKFAESRYLDSESFGETVCLLVEAFYYAKEECGDDFSDDELIDAMFELFEHKSEGTMELLVSRDMDSLCRMIRENGVNREVDDMAADFRWSDVYDD